MQIRPERPDDIPHIHQVNRLAFDTSVEADLVDALREHAQPIVSIVAADDEGAIVGHIFFSPVTLSSDPDGQIAGPIMGLAPMGVIPARQRQGIGSVLVREGIEACRRLDAAAIVVLGHAEYYPRFGFVRASAFGLKSEYDVPDEVFMVMELKDGVLREKAGTIRYHRVFAGAG